MSALSRQIEPVAAGTPVIALVDDDSLARHAIAAMLRRRGQVVYSFADAETFLAASLPDASECVLIDDRVAGMDDLSLLAALRRRPDAPVAIVISRSNRWQGAVAALKAGAADFLVKPIDEQALVKAIDEARERRRVTPIRTDRAAAETVAALPLRERQVLRGVAQGKSTKVIAHELGLSPRTVETYRGKLQQKIGEGTAAAVRLASAAGLL